MIGRRPSSSEQDDFVEPKGFDDFELRLGDVMRGERATMGKSLLDVQRELRIKASYIAAIENCDPDAFDTPGFIAGYVRSYARYLNMDPDKAFAGFCAESGFSVAHGMSAEASVVRKSSREDRLKPREGRDMFAAPATPFIPVKEGMFSKIEPGAIGSMLVLVGLISAIGYGGWTVLQEVQRVQMAPVDQTPVAQSDIDPLAGVQPGGGQPDAPQVEADAGLDVTRSAALDRLYRPQALDVPVLVARDAPISTLDPRETGAFARPEAEEPVRSDIAMAEAVEDALELAVPVPQVVEDIGPNIRMVAAYPSWVRVRSAEGNTLFEGIMEPGDTYDVPAMEAPPKLRTGESGAIYFAMGTDCYGPVGARGEVTGNLVLEQVALMERYAPVEPSDEGNALNRMFADLQVNDPGRLPKLPCQTN
jgi:cytoskeletal protein RodZ